MGTESPNFSDLLSLWFSRFRRGISPFLLTSLRSCQLLTLLITTCDVWGTFCNYLEVSQKSWRLIYPGNKQRRTVKEIYTLHFVMFAYLNPKCENTYTVVFHLLFSLHLVCFIIFQQCLHQGFGSWSSWILAASIRQSPFWGGGGDWRCRTNFLNFSWKPQIKVTLHKAGCFNVLLPFRKICSQI